MVDHVNQDKLWHILHSVDDVQMHTDQNYLKLFGSKSVVELDVIC